MTSVLTRIVLGCGLGAAACSKPEPRAAEATRIVSVGGAVTEIVFALGHGSDVVAVDTSSVFPESVATLPHVGYQRTLAAETVLAQSPDLVIASSDAGPPTALEQIRAAGVRVEIVHAAYTIDDAAKEIEAIGAIVHARAATTLAGELRTQGTQATTRATATPGAKALFVYARGAGTTMVAGTDTAPDAMIALAGGRNAASGFSGFKPLSAEVVVEAAPDVIIIPARGLTSLGGETGLLSLPGLASTPAAKAHRIIAMDDLLLLGFGPRLPAAIDELSRSLHATPGT